MRKNANKDEAVAWAVVRSILLLVAFLFIGYLLWWKQPCDVDAVFLNCRITGTWGDYIGIPVFFFGLFVMSGIHKGFSNLMNPPNSSKWNIILFVAMVMSVVLFWNW